MHPKHPVLHPHPQVLFVLSVCVVLNEAQQFVASAAATEDPPKMRSCLCSCMGTESQGASMGQQPQKPLSHRYRPVLASDYSLIISPNEGLLSSWGKRKRKKEKKKLGGKKKRNRQEGEKMGNSWDYLSAVSQVQ